jgi:hypothetical protein
MQPHPSVLRTPSFSIPIAHRDGEGRRVERILLIKAMAQIFHITNTTAPIRFSPLHLALEMERRDVRLCGQRGEAANTLI